MELAETAARVDGSWIDPTHQRVMSETRIRKQPRPASFFVQRLVALAAGGFIGSGARILVSEVLASGPGTFPWATVIVNLLGAWLLGLFLARRIPWMSVHFWAIGVLGSFTTFSAFSLEMFGMLDDGRVASALGYLIISLVGGILAVAVGDRLGGQS